MNRPLVLTILDGWGFSPAQEGNAIFAARKPNYDELLRRYPNTLVNTSGPSVGLPEGQMGNSEVGHLNIGAGRVVYMDVTRLDLLISSGEFFRHPVLTAAMEKARSSHLHLFGLVSDGGVHSHNTHLYALLRMAREQGVQHVFIHCFMDGRDTPPESGAGFVEDLQHKLAEYQTGKIASLSGRYYAMDRDKRWERVERAFNAMLVGNGEKAADPLAAIRRSYERGVTDEFIEPVTLVDDRNQPIGLIREGDVCINFNYRADRAREITMALTDEKLEQPSRSLVPRDLHYVMMTRYDKSFRLPFVLPPEHPDNILANVMAQANFRNLRVAETEKYAHVTYFFNGGNENPYSGEEREMVASPKVATYDLKPEMSADGVADVVIKAIEGNSFDVIVMNFANADMVGHSGKMEPTVRAVETVDGCLGRIHQSLRQRGGSWIITADHGNAETMVDPVTKGPHTYHTTNPVPFLLISEERQELRNNGALQDISPTILGVMGLDQPKDMSGQDLRIK
ncbi:MAG TPA: 2,3-bisphosphoglycerate-independent phosphoglycerate mutase [Bryobacteraceae bacterium]|nr:2,3-bisphosphoglycerate-independent phosphoglycerate mutase [Bryobacteraceae bacterium]